MVVCLPSALRMAVLPLAPVTVGGVSAGRAVHASAGGTADTVPAASACRWARRGWLWLNLKRHPLHGDPAQKPMDRGFIVLLLLTSLSGLALLAGRDTSAMALLLALHLGCVMALFATLPYGKFAHGVYRSAALLKWAIEKRQPNRLQLGSD